MATVLNTPDEIRRLATKIEIYNSGPEPHGWTIRVDERYHDHLCYGEMLEVLVKLTVDGRIGDPEKAPYGGMLTVEEYAERRAGWECRKRAKVDDTIDAEFKVTEGEG